ncbi:YozE family protein [Nitrococcus mobilis]|uniref:YozE family protein n=1 Tax=Nitrococcus mobilis TaxID=35797 RepID=UPI000323F42E
MPARYYLHGDEAEGQSSTYFCAICDSFEAESHFSDDAHIRKAKARLDATKRGLKKLRAASPRKYARPSSARSIFKLKPKLLKPTTSRFHRWLLRQADRDDLIGDLATDVASDPLFPRNTESRAKLREHLRRRAADSLALVALDEALREFRASRSSRDAIPPKLRFEILRRDGYRCQLCGLSASDRASVRLEIDHKVAVVKGGTNDPENLWVLCRKCNGGKGAGDL